MRAAAAAVGRRPADGPPCLPATRGGEWRRRLVPQCLGWRGAGGARGAAGGANAPVARRTRERPRRCRLCDPAVGRRVCGGRPRGGGVCMAGGRRATAAPRSVGLCGGPQRGRGRPCGSRGGPRNASVPPRGLQESRRGSARSGVRNQVKRTARTQEKTNDTPSGLLHRHKLPTGMQPRATMAATQATDASTRYHGVYAPRPRPAPCPPPATASAVATRVGAAPHRRRRDRVRSAS